MAFDNTAVGTQLAEVRSAADVDANAEALALAIKETGAISPYFDLTVGAEAANIRIVTGQLKDNAGNTLAGLCKFKAWLVEDATGILAVAAAASIKDGGVGTEVYGEGNSSYVGITDATGALDIDITDEAGASGKTFWLHIKPLDVLGVETIVSMAFD